MEPFVELEALATPALKVIDVAVPKGVATPALLVTVGPSPAGPAEAPEKVRLCEPV